MPIPFIKYSGCGNDFILVDNRAARLVPHPGAIARLCARTTGIGADGLLFVEDSLSDTAKMKIFNADGTEAEMCGNGVRCVAHYLSTLTPHPASLSIETMHQRIFAVVESDGISTEFPAPTHVNLHQNVAIEGKTLAVHCLDTGVPHAILFTGKIDDPTFPMLAKEIRRHADFAPRGTNVNLAQIQPDGAIFLRTYERGVEGETLACGTGAVAAALAAAALYRLSAPIVVVPRSNSPLTISFSGSPQAPERLRVKGSAVQVFTGTFQRELFEFPN